MSDPLLPYAVPRATAELICGVSYRTFQKCAVDTGLVEFQNGKITVDSLERYLRRPVSVEMYLRADRQRDEARDRQRNYRPLEATA